ncbi:MAG: DUF1549 and DUF1553 domain-containing protein [Armatimonadota bacterium]
MELSKILTAAAVLAGTLATAAPGFAAPARAKAAPKPPARPAESPVVSLKLLPESVTLLNGRDERRVLVTGVRKDGTTVDLTNSAALRPEGGLVTVVSGGYFHPKKAGAGHVLVRAAGKTARLPVTVKSLAQPPVSFVRDVLPILSKAGCNAGTCHGAAKGKNGFKLSLRGYDPDFDYHVLVEEVSGRRFNRADPDQSLILLKPIQEVPHQGGLVFEKNSRPYKVMREWIAQGVKSDVGKTSRVARLEVLPKNPTLQREEVKQELVVLAHYDDGTTRDVTREARFTSSVPEVAEITDGGMVTSVRRGESAVLVSYEGQYATNEFTVLGDRTGWKWAAQPQHNYVDRLVDQKLQRVKAVPSPLASDPDFLRRVYLDLTGLLPTPDAARAFLDDPRPSQVKRTELIEALLKSPEFDDHWTYKFADLLQVNRKFLGDKGVQAFRAWIHDSIAQNKPYDQFVREVLTASGSAYENPASNYMRVIRDTSTATENVTQLFLGVRFSCNKCHDHPFERWTQNQYYQLGAFFAQVGFKPGNPGDEFVYDRGTGDVTHPKDGRVMAPAFPVSFQGADDDADNRREALAEWLTSPKNPFFAMSTANRIWSYFMGRGIIDPVDDIRGSNPPSNAALLDALTQDFVKSGFDLRHLMRTIVRSRTYQSSIVTNKWNADDTVNFSHQVARRLTAEQLLDAITQATGSMQKYPGVPAGTRAQQLPDTRVAGGGFLDLFGRPARESPCECERTSEMSLAQALNLMNGDTIGNAVSDPNGRVARLVKSDLPDEKLVEELYLAAFSRKPTRTEQQKAVAHLRSSKDRAEGAQDLLWALINSPAFLFNR